MCRQNPARSRPVASLHHSVINYPFFHCEPKARHNMPCHSMASLLTWIELIVSTLLQCQRSSISCGKSIWPEFGLRTQVQTLAGSQYVDMVHSGWYITPCILSVSTYGNCGFQCNCWNNQSLISDFSFIVNIIQKDSYYQFDPWPYRQDFLQLHLQN